MTGGASASDEFIELYNPTSATLPLEGLEVVYVTSTGATVTRKAAWAAGATGLPSGAHLLIANSAGVFAGRRGRHLRERAGGRRRQRRAPGPGRDHRHRRGRLGHRGEHLARDATGPGASGRQQPRTAPGRIRRIGPGHRRQPGRLRHPADPGSAEQRIAADRDRDPDAAAQRVGRARRGRRTPTASPTAGADRRAALATESPPATPSPRSHRARLRPRHPSPTRRHRRRRAPRPRPSPSPISIAEARSLPDGTAVLVEGVALTDGDFTDGGGYLADGSAGIAVLLSDGTFARGQLLRVAGTVDDRYAQRTIRSSAAQITLLGAGQRAAPRRRATPDRSGSRSRASWSS